MVSTKRRTPLPDEVTTVLPTDSPIVAEGITILDNAAAQIFGSDIMDQAIKEPTLDLFLDRNPKTLNFPDDYAAMVKVLRRQREIFITADAKRKDGIKKGMETPNETNTSDAEED